MYTPDHLSSPLKKSRRSRNPTAGGPPSRPAPLPQAPLALVHQAPSTMTAIPLPPPSLSDPPEVYLPWPQLAHHPAAPNLTYRVPSHLLPAPPPPIVPASSSQSHSQQPMYSTRLPPELDFTSPNFNPSLALAASPSDLPTGFFQGHTSFPIFDNLAQFTALTWSAGTCAPARAQSDPPLTSNTKYSSLASTAGRLSLDLSSLTHLVQASPTPTDLHPHWHAWVVRLSAVHTSYHWDRMHRSIARTLAIQADAAVVEREARKVRVLKAREAALELRKLLHVWELAERDDKRVVDHPRHPRWVGVNLRVWEEAGVEVLNGADVLGGGNSREWGAAEENHGRGSEGRVSWKDDRGAGGKKSKGSAGLKWSHRKRIKDVRQ
ncbi:hypothetical protein BCR44DRAFT_211591 [Catenaria anguillulae PL171]|uniref:Uncharacterized protein n=1 Tax=Catenaria anguillulae PL171 TaxID=765915 RepID=A0A1Y2HZS7_9FUNG|nr:hypothetical protein BCR44DRAFT_211591 [Catenaria anguillulae PL171]